ncbi:Hypothetical protein SRAE_2000526600 [Strongyloides ratti]|uniref:Uncharacterized protein n=1 Tax=Strongyloides ratti TaxID=34506 RepID=A0A090LLP0_STRRB|nr:Hypothetical protein SRAE_2000526600 [Strongyloides ratti]CEF70641.1 Hypothetical protein SRAE_2000526600 [Strongyloides ratti]
MAFSNTLSNLTLCIVGVYFKETFTLEDGLLVFFFGNCISSWCITLYIVKRETRVKNIIKHLLGIRNNSIEIYNKNVGSNYYLDPIRNTETYFELYQLHW